MNDVLKVHFTWYHTTAVVYKVDRCQQDLSSSWSCANKTVPNTAVKEWEQGSTMKVLVTAAVLLIMFARVHSVPLELVRLLALVWMACTKSHPCSVCMPAPVLCVSIVWLWLLYSILIILYILSQAAQLTASLHILLHCLLMSRVSPQSPTCRRLGSSWRRGGRSLRRTNTRGRPGVPLTMQVCVSERKQWCNLGA